MYAVQPGRGFLGVFEGKIKILDIKKEMRCLHPSEFISLEDAKAEGGYTPEEFEELFRKMYPGWIARFAYIFEFIPQSSTPKAISHE